jgi:hypothetical protein
LISFSLSDPRGPLQCLVRILVRDHNDKVQILYGENRETLRNYGGWVLW